jgi:hypothetical protein
MRVGRDGGLELFGRLFLIAAVGCQGTGKEVGEGRRSGVLLSGAGLGGAELEHLRGLVSVGTANQRAAGYHYCGQPSDEHEAMRGT